MLTPATPPHWPTWQPDLHATLLFLHQEGKVLLIRKLRGIGQGKINGPGGKIDPGETALQGVVRETQEELCITPLDPVKRGELWFAMTDLPDIHCHVFTATRFQGTPTPTPEAIPLWCDQEAIPFDDMWEDDQHWLPQALQGETFNARFCFENEQILWKELTFGPQALPHWRGEPHPPGHVPL